MSKKTVTILMSGGLDSFIAYRMAVKEGHNIRLVRIDLGQPNAEREDAALQALIEAGAIVHPIERITMTDVLPPELNLDGENFFLPGRNLLLLVAAAIRTLPDELWVSSCKGEMHAQAVDKNIDFYHKAEVVLRQVLVKHNCYPCILSPFEDFSKADIVKLYLTVDAEAEHWMKLTWSCFGEPTGDLPCGNCVVCVRRAGCFLQAGFSEEYEQDPFTSPVGRNYLRRMVQSAEHHRLTGCKRTQPESPQFSHICRVEEVLPHWRTGYNPRSRG